ncbi:HesB/YadR/YfhF family protein [Salinicoccus kekensis]|uniref:Uncharacterized protein YneR n=1 Tax=Salinicoccus kekensis TaxID=714307 RepID=A0A285UQ11_9STAP|nr:iron-sulfur cluster biosynthesis family protein [Salinicoccus kekensis]SOC42351.1 uncharacterized protein YneR [Salinicoccus kekensis]
MNLKVTDAALKWFKDDVELESGDKVRFFVQIYGDSAVREGYSLAFTLDKDDRKKAVEYEKDGIEFYVNETDVWFFDDHDLSVEYDEEKDEVVFNYIGQKERQA